MEPAVIVPELDLLPTEPSAMMLKLVLLPMELDVMDQLIQAHTILDFACAIPSKPFPSTP